MKLLFINLLILCSYYSGSSQSKIQPTLQTQLDSLAGSMKADVGIAIIGSEKADTFFVNGNKQFVIMSVVKFPQAVALLNLAGEGKLDLDKTATFDSTELKRKTWSPFALEHPTGNASMSIKDCFKYSVGKSDNIVCDKLYDYLSPAEVQSFLHKKGYSNINIRYKYKEMNKDNFQFNNSNPKQMAFLLRDFYNGKLTNELDKNYLLNIMRNTETGPNRLKGLTPHLVIAHKTGTFFETDSFINALNDVGIVEMAPDTKPYYIVVFVNNSKEGEAATEKFIAQTNLLAYQYFLKKYKAR